MILTVTPNPAIDVTYAVDGLAPGASLRVDAPAVRAGGKGVNVARVLTQVGTDALAVVTAGGETGRELAAELATSGLAHRVVPVAGATRRSVALVDRAAGDTTILNERGTELAAAELDALRAAVVELLGAEGPGRVSCLVVSGSLPPGAPAGLDAGLVTAAHDAGVPAVVDAVGPPLLAACAVGVDLVKPNREELVATTGTADPVAGARALLEAGARRVVVTLGPDGMIVVDADRPGDVLRARLPRALRGNPTGAGDAAVAAAAVSLADRTPGQPDLAALLRRAVAWSAAAVLAPLAGELDPAYRALERDVVLTRS
ncbi:1-phosphofructokinase family hexose kinase [Isoptericola hypogeus]|uniref:1-phosphofructokinase family hexose kinase n=1 Tax=Isoptericola hypogeus TaxID=300179 RepID=A0ABP4VTL2_9MICO